MLAIVLTTLFTAHEALALSLRSIHVPAVVIRGEPVYFNCSYDLEGDTLYSIKWHKDNVEFYRYLPEDRPSAQKYDLDGIHIDLHRCKEGYVYMHHTDVDSEGLYRCEVSTDAPSFQMVKGEGEMRIYVFPTEGPKILGNKPRYGLGDEVNLTCLAAPSRPGAFLKWFMNGKEAPRDYLTRINTIETDDGQLIASLRLRFVVDPYHFQDDDHEGKMLIRCDAIISQAHTLTSEEILISHNATDLRESKTYSTSAYDSPTITGGRLRYQVGDTVSVNCTASKSQPPAELHWYINDKEVKQSDLLQLQRPIRYQDGQESTVLGLRFTVKHRHFQKGQMRLRCTAAALSEVKRLRSPTVEVTNNRQQVSGLHVPETARAVTNRSTEKVLDFYTLWSLFLVTAAEIFF